tara:strand:+ start:1720 stop:1995 length:276 start_codon:yes stop_codon:yes gene_type:complete
MVIDIPKILGALKVKISPTKDQKELAMKRIDICSTCEFKKGEVSDKFVSCRACGCFLHGKIFTNNNGECPKGKWDEIDKPYFRIKENKTLI